MGASARWPWDEAVQPAISDDNWKGFRKICDKVTNLRVDILLEGRALVLIQYHLAELNQPLCPNIVSLEVYFEEESSHLTNLLGLLGGSRLKEVEVVGTVRTEEDKARTLRALSTRPYQVVRLTVNASVATLSPLKAPNLPIYANFIYLQELDIHELSWPHDWEALSQCPALEVLRVEGICLDNWLDHGLDHGAQSSVLTFSALQSLSINALTFYPARSGPFRLFLDSRTPELKFLSIAFCSQAASIDLLTHLPIISPNVEHLVITANDSWTQHPFSERSLCIPSELSMLRRWEVVGSDWSSEGGTNTLE
ncbi:hypothetical protein FRB97_008029 [Tulasnella sp. 331]|nr:hypothetical protein FRB97_008029 [Tulasnella sp. 331]